MEAKEKPKDPSDPREYEAIPHGGWKLLVGIIAALCAFSPMIGSLAILLRIVPASLNDGLVKAVLVLGMFEGLGGLTALAAARKLRSAWPFVWLTSYWRRNVLGYVVAHYTEGDRAKHSEPFLSYKEDEADAWLWASPSAHFVVCWPLGGWFHHPTTWWRAKSSGWSVMRDTRFPGTPVKVTDKNGSSLRFAKLEDAMSFIAQRLECAATESSWRDSSDLPFSWLQALEGLSEDRDDARRDREGIERRLTALFQHLHDAAGNPSVNGPMHEWMETEIRRLIAERDAARGEVDRYKDGFLPAAVKDRDAARQEREEAVALIADLDRRFRESSRLHDKLQALRIHERIREWLYHHRFPRGWATLSMEGVAKQHDADAVALAEVRARIREHERRDRRRHRKGATATT